jgi:hypothetical protein
LHVDFTNGRSWKFCKIHSGNLVGKVYVALQKIVSHQ